MGYTDYFLIVWDYVNFAKSHNISSLASKIDTLLL